mmetsp:Transcript_40994/g.103274  ORF Transcript_40994/g.103274 Transcript_40994/m.103274 type:complete len:169 (+) Transcript_40994:609-1115(+)
MLSVFRGGDLVRGTCGVSFRKLIWTAVADGVIPTTLTALVEKLSSLRLTFRLSNGAVFRSTFGEFARDCKVSQSLVHPIVLVQCLECYQLCDPSEALVSALVDTVQLSDEMLAKMLMRVSNVKDCLEKCFGEWTNSEDAFLHHRSDLDAYVTRLQLVRFLRAFEALGE